MHPSGAGFLGVAVYTDQRGEGLRPVFERLGEAGGEAAGSSWEKTIFNLEETLSPTFSTTRTLDSFDAWTF